MKLTWIAHDGFLLSNGKAVYIDPFRIPGTMPKADIICLTHSHFDHTSKEDIAKIQAEKTQFVTTADSEITKNIHVLNPGESVELDGIIIEAIPAYNTDKAFHPKTNRWNGYLITIGKKKIYHAGDTDLIPEMGKLSCDVALLPVSGTYVMTAKQAVEAALKIKPKLAIPMHFSSIVGSEADADAFKELAEKKGLNVKILKPGESIDI